MKKLTLLLLLFSSFSALGQKQFLIGGSGTGKIAIVDKQSKAIVWEYALEAGTECNSVAMTKNGNIAYSYRWGARLIDKEGNVIFDYKLPSKNEELQSVSLTKKGFLLGICGSPARIVELNKKGEVISEASYDTKIADQHGQFRQIRKTSSGTYLLPLLSRGSIVEIDNTGAELKEYDLGKGPFSVTITKDGDLLAACGHSGKIFEIDPADSDVNVWLSNEDIKGKANIEFGAQIVELKNGNFVLANWLGHNGDMSQPLLIEFDPSGDVVWTLGAPVGDISLVSTVCPIY